MAYTRSVDIGMVCAADVERVKATINRMARLGSVEYYIHETPVTWEQHECFDEVQCCDPATPVGMVIDVWSWSDPGTVDDFCDSFLRNVRCTDWNFDLDSVARAYTARVENWCRHQSV